MSKHHRKHCFVERDVHQQTATEATKKFDRRQFISALCSSAASGIVTAYLVHSHDASSATNYAVDFHGYLAALTRNDRDDARAKAHSAIDDARKTGKPEQQLRWEFNLHSCDALDRMPGALDNMRTVLLNAQHFSNVEMREWALGATFEYFYFKLLRTSWNPCTAQLEDFERHGLDCLERGKSVNSELLVNLNACFFYRYELDRSLTSKGCVPELFLRSKLASRQHDFLAANFLVEKCQKFQLHPNSGGTAVDLGHAFTLASVNRLGDARRQAADAGDQINSISDGTSKSHLQTVPALFHNDQPSLQHCLFDQASQNLPIMWDVFLRDNTDFLGAECARGIQQQYSTAGLEVLKRKKAPRVRTGSSTYEPIMESLRKLAA